MRTPPMMAPATLSRPPRMTTGKTLRPRSASEKSTPPRTLPRMMPPSVETTRGDAPRQREDPLDAHPQRLGHLLVVRGGPHGHARSARSGRRARTRRAGAATADEAPEVHGRDRHRARGGRAAEENSTGNGRVSLPHVMLSTPADHAGEPEGHHDDRDDRLADERAQHPALDDEPEQDRHARGSAAARRRAAASCCRMVAHAT